MKVQGPGEIVGRGHNYKGGTLESKNLTTSTTRRKNKMERMKTGFNQVGASLGKIKERRGGERKQVQPSLFLEHVRGCRTRRTANPERIRAL